MKRFYIFLAFLIFLISFFIYGDLSRTFYQQDEWQSLGHNLVNGLTLLISTNPIVLLFGEARPLSTLLYYVLLGVFKFTTVPSAIFAILVHILNTLFVYYLVNNVTKNRIVAIASALFFATNSVSHQAVTWVSAVSTLPAATFILLSLISYFEFLEKSKRKYLILSIVSIAISLYFKGVGLFLFILLPITYFIYNPFKINKKNIAKLIQVNMPFIIFGSIMLLFRLGQFFLKTGDVTGYVSVGGNSNIFQTLILRVVLYPLTSLFQIFIPPTDFYSQMSQITTNQYKFLVGSPIRDLVAQSIVSDMISILGAFAILIILWVVIKRNKERITQKNLIFALLFFFLSFATFIFLDRDSSYLSSRYFYVGAIGAGIIFGYIVYFLANLNKYSKWIVFAAVFLFLFHHANIVRGDIDRQVELGNARKAVLNGIKTLKPTLDDQTIFYVTSDRQYYGPVTNPFQNGLGYVLEVWYYDGNNIPKEFLTENFLWDLGSEGYRSSGNKGFGYFQDIDKMVTAIGKNKLEPNIIHAFFIKSKEQKVVDVTKETRERISTISATTK